MTFTPSEYTAQAFRAADARVATREAAAQAARAVTVATNARAARVRAAARNHHTPKGSDYVE